MKKQYIFYFIIIIIMSNIFSCKAKSSLEALKRGRLNDLKGFYKKGDKLKKLVFKNDTFLTYAIKNNYDDISLWLIKNKINNLNQGDEFDNTPIMLAYSHNRKKIINELLKNKVDLNKVNFNGLNLIAIVVKKGDYKFFKKLINKYHVKIKFKIPEGLYENYTIIQFAIEGGNLKIIKWLKDKKFKFKKYNDVSLNLMMIASERGNIELMTYLESIGLKMSDRDKNGWTTLMSAAKSGKIDAVMLILGYGANVNAKTDFNWTALMSAVMSKNLEVVKVLVDAGADILIENNDGKNCVEISIDENNNNITNYLRKKLKESTK